MVTGKAPEYKRFWMGDEKGLGRVEIKPRIDKVIDMSRVSDRMNLIKALVQGIIISACSVYAHFG